MSETAGNTSAICRFQEPGIVGEHSDRALLAQSLRQREHGQVGLDGRPSRLHPLGGGQWIAHPLAETFQVVIGGHETALRLVLEPRPPDGGVDLVLSAAAPGREEREPALSPVVTEDAIQVEDDGLDHERGESTSISTAFVGDWRTVQPTGECSSAHCTSSRSSPAAAFSAPILT